MSSIPGRQVSVEVQAYDVLFSAALYKFHSFSKSFNLLLNFKTNGWMDFPLGFVDLPLPSGGLIPAIHLVKKKKT